LAPDHSLSPDAAQWLSKGGSDPEVRRRAFALSRPAPGLSWLDIGCGTGAVLRAARDSARPSRLTGLDLLNWLEDDLRGDVELITAPAETALPGLERADRILVIEALSSFEAPWTVLRAAASLVAPGGRIVVATVNIATLRHRVELFMRGQLTSFRPEAPYQLTPPLPHVIERILSEEGLTVGERTYAGRDVIPLTGGRAWPAWVQRRAPVLTSTALLLVGDRPVGATADHRSAQKAPRTSQ
jgi:precorrin-6B methylase 2